MTSEHQVVEQLVAATTLPHGRARAAAVEHVVALADAGPYEDLALDARLELVSAYQHGAEPAKTLAPFASVLARWRSRPETFSAGQIRRFRWQFKFIVSNALRFPSISLEQARGILDEMESEYRRAGLGLQPVHHYRHSLARHVGDAVLAAQEFDRWLSLPRTPLSDCAACDPEAMAEWHVERGEHEDAVRIADQVLRGEVNCIDQPFSIQSQLLLSWVALGRTDDARRAHLASYRAARSSPNALAAVARHIEFCALTGNESRGLEILRRHRGWLDEPSDPYSLMLFLAAAVTLLRRLVDLGPSDLMVDTGAGPLPVSDALGDTRARALTIATDFDRRNGSTYQSDLLTARMDAAPLVADLPLTTLDRRVQQVVRAPVGPGTGPIDGRDPAPAATPVETDPLTLADAFRDSWQLDWPARRRAAVAMAGCIEPAVTADAMCARAVLAWMDDDPSAATSLFAAAAEAYGDDEVPAVHAQVLRAWTALLAGDGDRAATVEAMGAAADRAAGLAPGSRADADTARWTASALMLDDRIDEARRRVDAALTRTPHPTLRSHLLTAGARMHAVQGDFESAVDLLEQAISLIPGTPHDAATCVALLAQLLLDLRRPADALPLIDTALPTPGPNNVALQQLRAECLSRLGRTDEAADVLADLVAGQLAAGDPVTAGELSYRLAHELLHSDRAVEAAEILEQTLPEWERRAGHGILPARSLLVRLLVAAGSPRDALDHADSALELVDGNADWGVATDVREQAGYAAEDTSDHRAAVDWLLTASRAAAEHDDVRWAMDLALGAGRNSTVLDPSSVEDAFAPAAALLDRFGDPANADWCRGEIAWRQAWILWQLDHNERAEPYAAQAERVFTSVQDLRAAGRSARLLGTLAAERDHDELARPHYERALELFAACDEQDMAEQTRTSLQVLDERKAMD